MRLALITKLEIKFQTFFILNGFFILSIFFLKSQPKINRIIILVYNFVYFNISPHFNNYNFYVTQINIEFRATSMYVYEIICYKSIWIKIIVLVLYPLYYRLHLLVITLK